MATLDKEIKKIYIFFSAKEKDIYQKINKKIQNKNTIYNKTSKEILKELNSINYISELSKQLIIYIYWNIKALKNILILFDNSTKSIVESLSYLYIKKCLSKNNSDLIYILSFKTLDETILAIDELSNEMRKIINKDQNYQDNKEQKNEFKKNIKEIKSNINEYNLMHDKIFYELSEWQKYLNINLEIPTSSHNSLFRSTSFIADSIPNKNENINYGHLNQNKLYNEINEMDSSSSNDSFSFYIDKKEKKLLKKYKIKTESLINDDSSISSINKNEILSKGNLCNLKFIYGLLFFYTYSYCLIIVLLNNNIFETIEQYCHYYGIIITSPILGNLLSLIYINRLIKYNYKLALVISLLFIILYYIFIFFGIIFLHNDKYIFFSIILINLGRVLLGLSSLNLLGKEYINLYVPKQIQIKINQTCLIYEYLGYFISFLLIGIQNYGNNPEQYNIYVISMGLIGINGPFLLIIVLFAFKLFKNPSNKQFKILNTSFFEISRKNIITNSITLEQGEKHIIEDQETDFENANNVTLLSGINHLKNYSNKIEENKKSYLKTIFTFLIVLLSSSQYTSENCIIFLPIFLSSKKKNEFKYELFNNSFSYIISLLLHFFILKKVSHRHLNKIILIMLSLISIIILILYMAAITLKMNYIIFIFNGLMIIIADFFKVVTVNLFIGLLPTENFDYLCIKSNNFITISNKIMKLLPGLFTIFIYFVTKDYKLLFFNINLVFNVFLFLLSFLFLLCFWKLKSNSFTRVLYSLN